MNMMSIEDALKRKFKENWKGIIASEFKSLEENKTWTVSSLPAGKRTIKTKWIFKIKTGENNGPFRFKARLVAKGFTQKEGIDFNETFAPVVIQESLRQLLAIAVNEGLKNHQMDV